jgi:MFS family permease
VAEANTAGRSSSALRRVLVPLALAQFICSFAGTNMNVMINDMSQDLDTTVQGIQVAITIFLLVMAALMIPGGKLTDRYGRKRCFTVGLVVYAIGALLSAAADPGTSRRPRVQAMRHRRRSSKSATRSAVAASRSRRWAGTASMRCSWLGRRQSASGMAGPSGAASSSLITLRSQGGLTLLVPAGGYGSCSRCSSRPLARTCRACSACWRALAARSG